MELTIITINLNNIHGLKKSIESVIFQTSLDFEYIIIDGGSTDGSVEVIQSFTNIPAGVYVPLNNTYDAEHVIGRKTEHSTPVEPSPFKTTVRSPIFPSPTRENVSLIPKLHTPPQIPLDENRMTTKSNQGTDTYSSPITYWISEYDSGIYSAMNKGIRLANGHYLHFLNSGDWLADNNVVKKMLNEISSLTSKDAQSELDPDILIGNVISVRPDRKVRYNKNNKEVSFFTFYQGTLHHASAYIRKALFNQYGLYDETLKIVSDWKWYLIVAGVNKANVHFTDTYVTYFDTSGISSTQLELDKYERRRVLEELLPSTVLADYDKYQFDILQMQRMKKYPLLYSLFWFIERCLFKIEKWNLKYFGWEHKREK